MIYINNKLSKISDIERKKENHKISGQIDPMCGIETDKNQVFIH